MRKVIWLSVFCLILSINGFGQAKEISRNEYYTAYREAYDKFNKTPVRREVLKEKYFKEGKPDGSMETITENISPDKFRFVVVEISDKENDKSDLIQIGENYYCRRNKGAWKKSKEGCDDGGGISGFSNVISQQFFVETQVENGKSVKFYRQYTVHKNKDTSGKDVLWYWESKFWVGEDGSFLRQETEAGLKETNEIRSKGETNYEYNPKDLKIEAPIKP